MFEIANIFEIYSEKFNNFEKKFRFNSELKRIADNALSKTTAAPLDIVKHMRQARFFKFTKFAFFKVDTLTKVRFSSGHDHEHDC